MLHMLASVNGKALPTGSCGLTMSEEILYSFASSGMIKVYQRLSKLIPLSAVRNRDRQDVDSVLQISDPAVTDVLNNNGVHVTHTVVLEKYRITDDNKQGLLKSPVAIVMGPLGNMFLSDIGTGKVWKVRVSHYPANITVEVDSLDCNGLYIPES